MKKLVLTVTTYRNTASDMSERATAVDFGAMPRPPSDTIQITARVPASWPAEFDALAVALSTSRPGMTITRTDAYRIALARGLQELQAELGVPARSFAEGVRKHQNVSKALATKKPKA